MIRVSRSNFVFLSDELGIINWCRNIKLIFKKWNTVPTCDNLYLWHEPGIFQNIILNARTLLFFFFFVISKSKLALNLWIYIFYLWSENILKIATSTSKLIFQRLQWVIFCERYMNKFHHGCASKKSYMFSAFAAAAFL